MTNRRHAPLLGFLAVALAAAPAFGDEPAVRVLLFEAAAGDLSVAPPGPPTRAYRASAMGFPILPTPHDASGLRTEPPHQFGLVAESTLQVPPGPYRLVLRARSVARLLIDGAEVARTPRGSTDGDGHGEVPDPHPADPSWRPLWFGDHERVVDWVSDGRPHRVTLAAIIGDIKGRVRPEPGGLCAAIAPPEGPARIIGGSPEHMLTTEGWDALIADERPRIDAIDDADRRRLAASEDGYWDDRHEIGRALVGPAPEIDGNLVDHYIDARLAAAGRRPNDPASDEAFFRRLALDTIGLIPDPDAVAAFLDDPSPDRRDRAVAAFLNDPRWADHWVGYWEDVLAENPRIVKPTLNNTGPFRWFLRDAFRDNLAFDRFVTVLIRMGGGELDGGPAGFAMATQNDVPMAAKAHVIAQAFLAADLKCARCHDAPFRPFEQEDLFGLAAMLANEPVAVPRSSTVPIAEGGRQPAVSITLAAGDEIEPHWSLTGLAAETADPAGPSSRERLAALVTSPQDERFARVIVNRLWARYLGVGLVEPVDDWDAVGAVPSHPELLDALADELVRSGYDLKHVARLILTSRAYRAEVDPALNRETPAEARLFAGPARRRMTAEQLLDSLFAAAGKPFGAELLCLAPDGRGAVKTFLNLGVPTRAWMFTSLSNERDRPALNLPVAMTLGDVLSTFGWRADRQDPLTVREAAPSPLQPAILANTVGHSRIARLSDDSAFTRLAIEADSPDALIEAVYLRVLSRRPSPSESARMLDYLGDTFDGRVVPGAPPTVDPGRGLRGRVSWSNHLNAKATRIQAELERIARAGDPPTNRLTSDFRERMEDVVWALVNSPEFLFVP